MTSLEKSKMRVKLHKSNEKTCLICGEKFKILTSWYNNGKEGLEDHLRNKHQMNIYQYSNWVRENVKFD